MMSEPENQWPWHIVWVQFYIRMLDEWYPLYYNAVNNTCFIPEAYFHSYWSHKAFHLDPRSLHIYNEEWKYTLITMWCALWIIGQYSIRTLLKIFSSFFPSFGHFTIIICLIFFTLLPEKNRTSVSAEKYIKKRKDYYIKPSKK